MATAYGVKAFRESFIVKAVIVISVIVLSVLWHKKPNGAKSVQETPPVCAGVRDISIGAGQTRTLGIRPDCWSGMISTELYKDFVVFAPGEVEYCFWTNNRCLKKPVSDKGVKWFGDIRASSFRLRGKEGLAKIVVEK